MTPLRFHFARRGAAAIAAVGALCLVLPDACQRASSARPEAVAPCFTPYPQVSAHVRIDGPGSFGPHVGDSLTLRVDSQERWRGILRSCHGPRPGLQMDLSRWRPAGDTVEFVSLGEEAWTRPRTWVLRLATRRTTARH